jgi:ubiquinone/menaquinone biosynthesis C-methylase UbiE
MLDQSELQRYLKKIDDLFGISQLLQLKTNDQAIIRYYTESEKGYRLFHSRDGSIHMTLNGESDEDNLGQARVVEGQIKEMGAQAVLELGCGKGFNVAYLAHRFPEAEFVGIDLTPAHIGIASKKYQRIGNVKFKTANFEALSFDPQQFDLIFEVEAVCHASDAAVVFEQVFRLLKPGGRFVLFDGFRSPSLTSFPPAMQTAVRLVEVTMAVKEFPQLGEWLRLAKSKGFNVIASNDLSNAIMPNLEKFQVLARGFYKFPRVSKVMATVLPPALVKNSVAGLLMPFTVSAGAQQYCSIVLEKPITN